MKNLILMTLITWTSALSLAADQVELKSSGKLGRAYVVVYLDTQETKPDGSVVENSKVLCEKQPSISIYDARSAGKNDIIIARDALQVRCKLQVGSIQADVLSYPMIINSKVFDENNRFIIDKNLWKFPEWLTKVAKAEKYATAYLNYSLIVPHNYVVSETSTPPEDYIKLFEMFEASNSIQAVGIVGQSPSLVTLESSIQSSGKYCNQNPNEEICSLKYKIRTQIIFKAE